ncbi:MAG TPA: hypothetical protein VMY88_06210 [Acidimicrobiales bacterium]|nr:hypothetical protein [Acidimicrobiales bacterium]
MAENSRPRGALLAALAIGLGLAVAPAIFGMFSRAPAGGQMISEFKPYMRATTLDAFGADLQLIDAAHREVTASEPRPDSSGVSSFGREWPAIERDMSSMLSTIESNVPRYNGLVALPPFWAFPWFFVLPGLMIAGLAAWALRSPPPRRRLATLLLAACALSVIAAPAVFQMFTRAPGGAAMINDFRPLMTDDNIAKIQGSFLVIAGAEGELRTAVLPQAAPGTLPATREFVAEWPRIAAEMAPMIGAMADNLDNFAGVAALPPFTLFPWFFVVPGVLVFALALVARPPAERQLASQPAAPAATPLLERSAS